MTNELKTFEETNESLKKITVEGLRKRILSLQSDLKHERKEFLCAQKAWEFNRAIIQVLITSGQVSEEVVDVVKSLIK